MNRRQEKARLLALAGLALLLFSPPLILLFDQPSTNGLSWLPLYLFVAWGAVIGMAAWWLERPDVTPREKPTGAPQEERQQHEK